MKTAHVIDTTQINPEARYRPKEIAWILGRTSESIFYSIKHKYFTDVKVVGGTPKNRRFAIKWQSVIDFVESLNA